MYDTSIYADGRRVIDAPWEWVNRARDVPATEAVAQEEGRGDVIQEEEAEKVYEEVLTKSQRKTRKRSRQQERKVQKEEDRKQQDMEKMKGRREKRESDFFIDGHPTEMAYFTAQAIATIEAYFHHDPDNPPTVKGFIRSMWDRQEAKIAVGVCGIDRRVG
jgi:hypothetical protein